MFENLFAPYLPHIMTARDRCMLWGVEVLDRLDRIVDAVSEGSPEPTLKDVMLRITKSQVNGVTELDRVPTNQVWIIDYIAASGPWSMTLAGALLLASTNGYNGAVSAILMPGETASIVTAAPTDVTIQITRKYLEVRPAKAHSGAGREGRYSPNGPGIVHDTRRDVMDTGVAQAPTPGAPARDNGL